MNPMLAAIAIPFAGAAVVPALPRLWQGRFFIALLAAAFACTAGAAAGAFGAAPAVRQFFVSEWIGFSLVNDGLSSFMALISAGIALAVGVYALGYFAHEERSPQFYTWSALFVGAMLGLVYSSNLILMICFWEITSVCSWKLIGLRRGAQELAAGDKAFLVTFFGASLMLAGIALIYLQYGTFELGALRGAVLGNAAAFLILAGIAAKSAQLPLQAWLPDAGVAPTPVTALLHAAVLVKIGVYAFARIFGATMSAPPEFFAAVVGLSTLTIIVACGGALLEKDMKRILAYSTVSQLGYIMLVLALNTPLSLRIAMAYILAHSIAKGGLFLCAGIVEHAAGTKDITRLGGLARTMPRTSAAYLLCAFSVAGIPPLFGFWPKLTVVYHTISEGYLAAGITAVCGALITLLYLVRLYNAVFGGALKTPASEERDSPMVWVVLGLGIASLALGLLFWLPLNLIERMVIP